MKELLIVFACGGGNSESGSDSTTIETDASQSGVTGMDTVSGGGSMMTDTSSMNH